MAKYFYIILNRNVKPSKISELPKRLTAMVIPRIKPTKIHFFFTLGRRRAVASGEKNLQTLSLKYLFLNFPTIWQFMLLP